MKLKCRGSCGITYRAPPGRRRFIDGGSRCRTCDEWIDWEGLWCPCCRGRISRRPRSKNNLAAEYRRQIEASRIS